MFIFQFHANFRLRFFFLTLPTCIIRETEKERKKKKKEYRRTVKIIESVRYNVTADTVT